MARPTNIHTIPRSQWTSLRVTKELHHRAKLHAERRAVPLQSVTATALQLYLDAKKPPTFADELKVYIRVLSEKLARWDRPGAETVLMELERKMCF